MHSSLYYHIYVYFLKHLRRKIYSHNKYILLYCREWDAIMFLIKIHLFYTIIRIFYIFNTETNLTTQRSNSKRKSQSSWLLGYYIHRDRESYR